MSCITHHNACECREKKCEELQAILEEAAEWVCNHYDALEDWENIGKPPIRVWCSDCHNYLRTEEDRTFPSRLSKFLVALKGGVTTPCQHESSNTELPYCLKCGIGC